MKENDQFGRKMYLVLCLQRGMLKEALKTAKEIQESEPFHPTINELIRCIPQRQSQLEAKVESSDTETDDGFASYSSSSSSSESD